jgi:hypothetical protein
LQSGAKQTASGPLGSKDLMIALGVVVLDELADCPQGRPTMLSHRVGTSARRIESSTRAKQSRPIAGARDPHGTVTETVYRDVSNPQLAGGAGVERAHGRLR